MAKACSAEAWEWCSWSLGTLPHPMMLDLCGVVTGETRVAVLVVYLVPALRADKTPVLRVGTASQGLQ